MYAGERIHTGTVVIGPEFPLQNNVVVKCEITRLHCLATIITALPIAVIN